MVYKGSIITTVTRPQGEPIIFYIKGGVLLLGRLRRVWLGSFGAVLCFCLKFFEFADGIEGLADPVAVADVDVCPSSAVADGHCPWPDQISKHCHSVD